MKIRNIITAVLLLILVASCTKDYTSTSYLKTVLHELEGIESATYNSLKESWNPWDTIASFTVNQYVEAYSNPMDSTIGASWAVFENEDKTHLDFAYDGYMRTLIYDDSKLLVIDSFKVRKLPFRPISAPFYNYTESIVKYILETNDSITLVQKDRGDELYVKLVIHEENQIEFFGRGYRMPLSPYSYGDETSAYEMWIDKKSDLPYKYRREMSHNISARTVLNSEFNNIELKDFVASDYFPKDYEIRQYGDKRKRKNAEELLGQSAPQWLLKDTQNKAIELKDLKSKVVLLQFTSVNCGPCRASIPFLKELSTAFDAKDLEFVAIECSNASNKALEGYKESNHFDYTFIASSKKILNDYAIKSFPVFYILDEDRIVRHVKKGYGKGTTDNHIRKAINQLLEE